MISYEAALKTAKSLKDNIDACDEYTNAYVFKCRAEQWDIGGSGPVVILKDNGRAINQTEFYDVYGNCTHIREFDVE